MTSQFDLPEVPDVAGQAKIAGSSLAYAKHEVNRSLGDFLKNASTEEELVDRFALADVDEAIDAAVEQHMGTVSDPKAKLVRALIKDWKVAKEAGKCRSCGETFSPNGLKSHLEKNPDHKVNRMKSNLVKGAPFAGYADFAECVSKNADKDNPNAYCGKIKHQVEDSKKSSRSIVLSASDEAAFREEIAKLAKGDVPEAFKEQWNKKKKDGDDEDEKKSLPPWLKDKKSADEEKSEEKSKGALPTCADCGADIERDPMGEEPRTWHHADGKSHDHEARPRGHTSKKESAEESSEGNGQTCAECGASIERDPEGEEPRTWHHSDGKSHDHEAKPKGESKEKDQEGGNPFGKATSRDKTAEDEFESTEEQARQAREYLKSLGFRDDLLLDDVDVISLAAYHGFERDDKGRPKNSKTALKYKDLPESRPSTSLPDGSIVVPRQVSMTCEVAGEMHGVYSATKGDYFMADPNSDVTCSECGAPMILVEHYEGYRPIAKVAGEPNRGDPIPCHRCGKDIPKGQGSRDPEGDQYLCDKCVEEAGDWPVDKEAHSVEEIKLSLDAVRELCPPCADKMARLGYKAMKLSEEEFLGAVEQAEADIDVEDFLDRHAKKHTCSCGREFDSWAAFNKHRFSEGHTSKTADYQGWTNWETWNTYLWLSNDETAYHAAARASDIEELKSLARDFVGDDVDFDEVNWDEVWEGFEEDRTGSKKGRREGSKTADAEGTNCPNCEKGILKRETPTSTTEAISILPYMPPYLMCDYCWATFTLEGELIQRHVGSKQAQDDPTEDIRRQQIPQMPAELQARIDAGEQVWTTEQLQEDFEVEGFMAPYVVVRRKSDGQRGSLMFTHHPRFYFGWEEHTASKNSTKKSGEPNEQCGSCGADIGPSVDAPWHNADEDCRAVKDPVKESGDFLREHVKIIPVGAKEAADPTEPWLQERNNDPYGTPPKHEFWNTVDWEQVGNYKIFEKDGKWFAHDEHYNSWMRFPSRDAAVKHAEGGSRDVWASKEGANCPKCGSAKVDTQDEDDFATAHKCSNCGHKWDKDLTSESSKEAPKNPFAKSRPPEDPYEIWSAGDWHWHVLKKWQIDDNKPYARWFCLVKTPIVPEGEMGDVYVAEIKGVAVRTYVDPKIEGQT